MVWKEIKLRRIKTYESYAWESKLIANHITVEEQDAKY